MQEINISIHAPAKGATLHMFVGFIIQSFQSTLPRRERHNKNYLREGTEYFNPRSREGSDNGELLTYFNYGISIHAPAKGATGCQ